MKSRVLSFFLLATTLGNLIIAMANRAMQTPGGTARLSDAQYFGGFTTLMASVCVGFIPVLRYYRPVDQLQGSQRGVTTEDAVHAPREDAVQAVELGRQRGDSPLKEARALLRVGASSSESSGSASEAATPGEAPR